MSVIVLCVLGFPYILVQVIVMQLMSYACVCRYHYILLEIRLERGVVTVLDSKRKDPQEYADMTEILKK